MNSASENFCSKQDGFSYPKTHHLHLFFAGLLRLLPIIYTLFVFKISFTQRIRYQQHKSVSNNNDNNTS